MIRKTPLRPRSLSKKLRMWSCRFCPAKSETGKKKCSGCGVLRGKKAASWEAEARKLHRQYVVPDGARCAVCGRAGELQDAHIFGRGANPSPAVKWHPYNGMPLCGTGCHYKYDSYQLGDRGVIAVKFMGEPRYAELQRIATTHWNYDWPAVIARLRAALAAKKEAA